MIVNLHWIPLVPLIFFVSSTLTCFSAYAFCTGFAVFMLRFCSRVYWREINTHTLLLCNYFLLSRAYKCYRTTTTTTTTTKSWYTSFRLNRPWFSYLVIQTRKCCRDKIPWDHSENRIRTVQMLVSVRRIGWISEKISIHTNFTIRPTKTLN